MMQAQWAPAPAFCERSGSNRRPAYKIGPPPVPDVGARARMQTHMRGSVQLG